MISLKTQGSFIGCPRHDDDYEACINYSGTAPCEIAEERDALAADAARYRYLTTSGLIRTMSLDMGGHHAWTGIGRLLGYGPTIDAAIDAEIAHRAEGGE